MNGPIQKTNTYKKMARDLIIKHGSLKGLEVRYVKPNGETVYVLANSVRLKNRPNRVIFFVSGHN